MKLSMYELKLRNAAEKAMGIKIPGITCGVNRGDISDRIAAIDDNMRSDMEVQYIEAFLRANGKEDVANLLWKEFGNEIEDLPMSST